MLRKRIAVISSATIIGVLCGSLPALADDIYGKVDCGQTPSPVCDLDAGRNGSNGNPDGNSANNGDKPGRPSNNNPGNGKPHSGDTIFGGDSNLASCSYVKSDYQPPSGGFVTIAETRPLSWGAVAVQPAVFTRPLARSAVLAQPVAQPAQDPQGAWYVWKCTSAGFADTLYRAPVWIPDGRQPGVSLLPSPAELAQMARRQLRLPTPTIAASPAGDQLVNLPTWLWLSSGWGPLSATASVPGVSVTATAKPRSVEWSMGDGSTVTCTGPGTPFRAGSDPRSASPDCGHTYRTSSARQAGHAFPVTATVHWTVTWSGAGQGGTFGDMTTTSNAAFRVAESQALNNGGG